MNRVKKEAQKRRFVRMPNGDLDLHEGRAMTFGAWHAACTDPNPLDRWLRKTLRFGNRS